MTKSLTLRDINLDMQRHNILFPSSLFLLQIAPIMYSAECLSGATDENIKYFIFASSDLIIFILCLQPLSTLYFLSCSNFNRVKWEQIQVMVLLFVMLQREVTSYFSEIYVHLFFLIKWCIICFLIMENSRRENFEGFFWWSKDQGPALWINYSKVFFVIFQCQ